MRRLTIHNSETLTDIKVSEFIPTGSTDAEYCAMITCPRMECSFEEAIQSLISAYDSLKHRLGPDVKAVFKRYFLSDATNQAAMIPADHECAVSVIGQPPLDGSKVALWVQLARGAEVTDLNNGFFKVIHGGHAHYWQGSACVLGAGSEEATLSLLGNYTEVMSGEGCTLEHDCIRTWFFVRDVDVNYAGLVRGRNLVFESHGLTPATHFIASTGIGGSNPDRTTTVTMDTYTVSGLDRKQIRHLYAPTHLNPTYEYGVAFERGTAIDYDDRRHVLISGTASIDNRGRVVHPGDIRKQTLRMWENVDALLSEAGCGFEDVMHIIVYLRDIADYRVVSEMFGERFPDIPKVIVLAPVCRPEWLIEMECMAIKPL